MSTWLDVEEILVCIDYRYMIFDSNSNFIDMVKFDDIIKERLAFQKHKEELEKKVKQRLALKLSNLFTNKNVEEQESLKELCHLKDPDFREYWNEDFN